MSWITAIGPSEAQVEYRLSGRFGCSPAQQTRVKATPLVEAVRRKAADRGVDPTGLFASPQIRGLYADLVRQLERGGEDLRMSGPVAARIAMGAGIDLSRVYSAAVSAALTGHDAQLAYRLAGTERALMWIGNGCRDLEITPGSELVPEQFQMARDIMKGLDPRTGAQLVSPKLAVDPRAKVAALPLIQAVKDIASSAGAEPEDLLESRRLKALFTRTERQIRRFGDTHRVSIGALRQLGAAVGTPLESLYGDDVVLTAVAHEGDRVVAGNAGYDIAVNLPKAISALFALADTEMAEEVEDIFVQCLKETVDAVEGWAAYAMRGHHGDGRSADRIESSGLIGWVNVHRAARPVGGRAFGDPHLHAHVTIANMCHGNDGHWSTIAAGGRDLYRHASALDALMQARLRHVTKQRWGIEWERNARTGVWEIVGIPQETIRLFSKRNDQILRLFESWGIPIAETTAVQQHTAAAMLKEAKNTEATTAHDDVLRNHWRAEARHAGQEPKAILASVVSPDTVPAESRTAVGVPPRDLDELCRWIFRIQEGGLTAHRKDCTRAQALAAVMDAIGEGVISHAEAERLTDLALTHGGYAVPLKPRGPRHLSNSARYTTGDIIAAERVILSEVRARFNTSTAVVPHPSLESAVEAYQLARGPGFLVSAEQRAALRRIVCGGHGVDALIGVAGAGKTTLMEIARTAWEVEGKVVAGASTAAVACANLQLETGVPTMTVAGWLSRIASGQGMIGVDVLILDESAMVDDRQCAKLLAHAGHTGTKVVGIGDPAQLQSPGVGGSFAAVHVMVGGLTLTTNYRQIDDVERHALELWRDDERREALRTWARHGRVHASKSRDESMMAMLALWDERRRLYPDVHDSIRNVLMLAGRNRDVEDLNRAARAIRRANGEISVDEVEFAVAAGGSIAFAMGDIVLLRKNEYREWRTGGDRADVLNGYRGVVTDVDCARGIEVEWRQIDRDGRAQLIRDWVSPQYIADAGLGHGAAMTVHKTQGLTADYALIYGADLHSNAVYTALSRDRREAHLFLPHYELEPESERISRGVPRSPEEQLDRALNAFSHSLEDDRTEGLIVTELGTVIAPIVPAPANQVTPRAGGTIDGPVPYDSAARAVLRGQAVYMPMDASQRHDGLDAVILRHFTGMDGLIAGQLADPQVWLGEGADLHPRMLDASTNPPQPWYKRPFGALTKESLVAYIADLEPQIADMMPLAEHAESLARARLATLEAGCGPAVAAVIEEYEQLAKQVAAIAELTEVEDEIHALLEWERRAREELTTLEAVSRTDPMARRRPGPGQPGGAAARRRAEISANGLRLAQLSTRRTNLHRLTGAQKQRERIQRKWAGRRERQALLIDRAHRTDLQDAEHLRAEAERLQAHLHGMVTQLVEIRAEMRLRSVLPSDVVVSEASERSLRTAASREDVTENQAGPEGPIRPMKAHAYSI